jgi:hypothetical protein
VQGAEPPAGVWGILSGGQVIGDPKKCFFLSAARGGKFMSGFQQGDLKVPKEEQRSHSLVE